MKKASVIGLLFVWMLLFVSPVMGQDNTTCPGALPSRLFTGDGGSVTPGQPNNNLSQPSTNSQI
jgi:hypothetical protein